MEPRSLEQAGRPPLIPERRRAPLMRFGVFDGPSESVLPTTEPSNGPIFDSRPAWSFADYEPRFRRVHRHLREGDCYQVNLTFPIEAGWSGDSLSAFTALVSRHPQSPLRPGH